MKLITQCLIVFVVIAKCSVIYGGTIDPCATAAEYLKGDFDGNADNWLKKVIFTSKRKAVENKKDPEFGGLIKEVESEPVVLVTKYKITNCKQNDIKATVSYKYNKVGEIIYKNGTRKVLKAPYNEVAETLRLKSVNGQWKVVDPVVPKVSIYTAIKVFNDGVSERDKLWLERNDATESQKKYHRELKEALDELRQLDDHVTPEGSPRTRGK